jgi:hypothetical protein
LCDVRAPAKTNAIADKAFRANIDHKTSVWIKVFVSDGRNANT